MRKRRASLRFVFTWLLTMACSLSAAAWGWHNYSERRYRPATTIVLDRLHAACVEEMIRSTCKVMGSQRPSPGATSVFVAGVGPVDASYYGELQASGDAMCSVVRRACEMDWNGSQCLTARALYGAVAAKP